MKAKSTFFKLTVTKEGRTPKEFQDRLTFEYTDKNFLQIEEMIRNVCSDLGGEYISKEFYNE